jgi:arginine-tRNA-protein transferase
MDALWEEGWRHFGPVFFRYTAVERDTAAYHVQPLRIRLDRFEFSKSQRRILRKNSDLALRIGPSVIDDQRRRLFDAHKSRFKENVPDSLEDFLGWLPASHPCHNIEVGLYAGKRLLAASYLDLGRTAVSSVYGIFDPAQGQRSLGICTMLHEIEYARDNGYTHYYPGYAFHEASVYDYKKRFCALEWYDWNGHWQSD